MNEKLLASLGLLSVISLQQINSENLLNLVQGLSFFQLLILMIQGSVLIANLRLEGWRDKIPIYLFKCKKHGYQLSYPQGHMMVIRCPKCAKEELVTTA
jgi:hypothetical protein